MSVELDLPSLARWIRDAGEPVTGSLRGTRVGQGQSTSASGIAAEAGRIWIARLPPLVFLLASAHDVARDLRIIAAVESSGVPVPATIGVCEVPAVADVPVVIMEHFEGTVID